MTKNALMRDRADLKQALTDISRIATAHRRRGMGATILDPDQLIEDLNEIDRLVLVAHIGSAKLSASDKGDKS